jgi:hypothetical protein
MSLSGCHSMLTERLLGREGLEDWQCALALYPVLGVVATVGPAPCDCRCPNEIIVLHWYCDHCHPRNSVTKPI